MEPLIPQAIPYQVIDRASANSFPPKIGKSRTLSTPFLVEISISGTEPRRS